MRCDVCNADLVAESCIGCDGTAMNGHEVCESCGGDSVTWECPAWDDHVKVLKQQRDDLLADTASLLGDVNRLLRQRDDLLKAGKALIGDVPQSHVDCNCRYCDMLRAIAKAEGE